MAQKGKYTYSWPRPAVTCDALVFRTDTPTPQLLLIQRGTEPFKGNWAFPGGYVDIDEELHHAAARELAEETGLQNMDLKQYKTVGTIGRDPRGRQITVVYWGIADPSNTDVKGADDADLAQWFPVDDLPPMAFDHAEIAASALKELSILKT
ncbi:Bifunctional NMN adenylyltransferase/Nudix hydrolase [Anaerohalosphaera lusitana]|uniref:Bifunctional NMN adenylyltransferase/Nudix hydrolase n=1 Tax=Anaerohalosphaera lusitana TaxID=1936003 RepID=A0A1U9NJ98_9BACT|nr:NUDIX hydrolase [Anaerohalosphaera lusitana]AQT68003.1 Bifunctional NMN adenylyltransferase/Nudix hydrolase [Anaerohalosphaera lusitana]